MSGLRVTAGSTLQIGGPSTDLLKIVRRGRKGIWVEPTGGDGDPEFLADDFLLSRYLANQLRYWPANLSHLDEVKMDRLRSSFSAWPKEYQREANRRLAYVSAMRNLLDLGALKSLAAKRSAESVFEQFHDEWDEEERDEALIKRDQKRHRDGEPAEKPAVEFKGCEQPAASTVQAWYKLWAESGYDSNALIPAWDRRGYRKARLSAATRLIAKTKVDLVYMTRLQPKVSIVYRQYKDECEDADFAAEDIMSERSFHAYIRRLYTDEQRCRAREGPKAAWQKFGLVAEQPLPDIPLEEVEIDHCLVDVILTWNGRPCGRPWLTVLLDRATKCVVGIHITFHPPSYQTVRMALLHAAFPKDLSGYPEIKRDWPFFGVPNYLISDQGKEFKGRHYLSVCDQLNITPIRLRGRSPWLKGAIERLFGCMGIEVFDMMEGATKFQSVEGYNSVKSARLDKGAFVAKLIKWIVDRYHHRPHSRLEKKYGKGATPAAIWQILSERHGHAFLHDSDKLASLTAKTFYRKITKNGITIGSQTYLDKKLLKPLRESAGGTARQWKVLQDDSDWGHVRVVDDRGPVPRILVIPNHNADLMAGVGAKRFAIILEEARQMTPSNKNVSNETLYRARAALEEQAERLLRGEAGPSAAIRNTMKWAQYGETGSAVTPLPGFLEPTPANDLGNLDNAGSVTPAPSAELELTDAKPETAPVTIDIDAAIAARANLMALAK